MGYWTLTRPLQLIWRTQILRQSREHANCFSARSLLGRIQMCWHGMLQINVCPNVFVTIACACLHACVACPPLQSALLPCCHNTNLCKCTCAMQVLEQTCPCRLVHVCILSLSNSSFVCLLSRSLCCLNTTFFHNWSVRRDFHSPQEKPENHEQSFHGGSNCAR